ncbi:CRISPR-associated endoribonuclease Cas6 [Hymenobacter sp. H14-R3]|uniref:CRISPR-associated endoribonuclease Cas6 n=1 Tax=Hymenobacter sp. H14-R3 TaxID=3046308 RepID=UPI0024BA4B74|nr:CRISPR-associated endoribonuclease Cas6 [Hymenobacter sp. H14-R3]MDJ0367940.1 CRISPR-associated endoribonuclease Cas6 [Hymenobacter sp. H14-R3]
MRLHVYLSASQVVPFDYLPTLKSAFHRWAGHNEALHAGLSLYSYGWLHGGRAGRGGIRFAEGASWFISAPDETLIQELVSGVVRAPALDLGLAVRDVRLQRAPEFAASEQPFRVASPVFIKHETEKGKPADHLLPGHALADELLTDTLRHKLRQAGLDDAGAAVRFDPAFIASAKSKLFAYKQVQCRGSICPVLVSGSAEQIQFAWEVGVGHSTGIGCGALV